MGEQLLLRLYQQPGHLALAGIILGIAIGLLLAVGVISLVNGLHWYAEKKARRLEELAIQADIDQHLSCVQCWEAKHPGQSFWGRGTLCTTHHMLSVSMASKYACTT